MDKLMSKLFKNSKEDMTTNGIKKRRQMSIYKDPNRQRHVKVYYLSTFPRPTMEMGEH